MYPEVESNLNVVTKHLNQSQEKMGAEEVFHFPSHQPIFQSLRGKMFKNDFYVTLLLGYLVTTLVDFQFRKKIRVPKYKR
jgi:hypothetical protein